MSFQEALCYRVLRTHDIKYPLEYGITMDDFVSHEAKGLWGMIITYYTDARCTSGGSIPPEWALQQRIQGFYIGDDMPGVTMETLCNEVRRLRLRTEANAAAVEFSGAISHPDCDPMGPFAAMQGHIARLSALGARANTDVSALQGAQRILTRMILAEEGADFSKLCWPWAPMQEATFGIQPDDYIVLYGRPKSMKTWVLCFLIAHAFCNEKRVLVYTKEMTPDNVFMRTLSCVLKLVYSELRGAILSKNSPLSPQDREKLTSLIYMMQNDGNLASMITVLSGRDCGPGLDTVPWLRSKIEHYKPTLMFIDGLYLLSDHRKHNADHQRVLNISRDIRDMVLGTETPVIATMQANRKAAGHKEANLDEIAYSDALAQDATVAARVIADRNSPVVSFIIGGSREFSLPGFKINARPAVDFSYLGVLTAEDAKKAIESDAKDAEAESEAAAAAKPAKKAKAAKKPAVKDTSVADENGHIKDLQDELLAEGRKLDS